MENRNFDYMDLCQQSNIARYYCTFQGTVRLKMFSLLFLCTYYFCKKYYKPITVQISNRSFPDGSVVKNPPADPGDMGSVPGLGRSPGKGNGKPLQNACLGNPMDRGAWQATVHGVIRESCMT